MISKVFSNKPENWTLIEDFTDWLDSLSSGMKELGEAGAELDDVKEDWHRETTPRW